MNLKLIFFRKNNTLKIMAFNKIKMVFTHINTTSKEIQIDFENNFINVNTSRPFFFTKIYNRLNELYFSYTNFFFNKIKFKGKGFRLKIRRKKKIIKFFFGHSHMTNLFLKNTRIFKNGKYKFMLKNVLKKNLDKITKIITSIKINNMYTNRGIRKTRQIIFRRKGKKGSYN